LDKLILISHKNFSNRAFLRGTTEQG